MGTGAYAAVQKIQQLLASYEAKVAALKVALAELQGAEHVAARAKAPSVIAQALALDGARRRGRPPGAKTKTRTGAHTAAKLARRKATARLLARAAKAKRPVPGGSFGPNAAVLARHGYLKREGDGYVRTDKPFSVEKPTK